MFQVYADKIANVLQMCCHCLELWLDLGKPHFCHGAVRQVAALGVKDQWFKFPVKPRLFMLVL